MVPNNSRNAPDFGGVAEAVTRAANVRDFEHDGRERRGLCREVRGAIGATFNACPCPCVGAQLHTLPMMKNILPALFVFCLGFFYTAAISAVDLTAPGGKAITVGSEIKRGCNVISTNWKLSYNLLETQGSFANLMLKEQQSQTDSDGFLLGANLFFWILSDTWLQNERTKKANTPAEYKDGVAFVTERFKEFQRLQQKMGVDDISMREACEMAADNWNQKTAPRLAVWRKLIGQTAPIKAETAPPAGAAVATFSKGDSVLLVRDEPIYFQDAIHHGGKKGDVLTVHLHNPTTHKVFVLATDNTGQTIALNVKDDAVELVKKP